MYEKPRGKHDYCMYKLYKYVTPLKMTNLSIRKKQLNKQLSMKNNPDNDVNNNENKNYNTTFKQNEIWKRFLSMMNGLVTHSFTEHASTVVVRK